MKKTLISLFIIFSVALYSQDFIIKENGEKIECKIKSEDSASVYFKMKNKGGNTVNTYLKKDQIQGFYIDSTNKKSFMFEVNFQPFDKDEIISFEYFQTKFMINKKTNFRLGVQINRKKNILNEDDYDPADANKETAEEELLLIGIKPGFEFHFLNNSRISPYWGFEFILKNKWAKSEYSRNIQSYSYNYFNFENGSVSTTTTEKITTTIDGSWRTFEQYVAKNAINSLGSYSYQSYQITNYDVERAFFMFGANLLLGTDVNITKNLYLGYELGLRYENTKFKKIEIESSAASESETLPSAKTTGFGFFYNNSIRLGIKF